jgi:hypothetical protein
MTKTEPLEHTTWQHSLSRDQNWETKQRTVRDLAKKTDSMAPESGTHDFSWKEKSDLGEAHKTVDDHEATNRITKRTEAWRQRLLSSVQMKMDREPLRPVH